MWIFEELQTETGLHCALFYKKAKEFNMQISGAFGSDDKFLGLGVSDKDGESLIKLLTITPPTVKQPTTNKGVKK
jgi:hypothetical protein